MIKINLLPVRAAKKKETARQQISIAVMSLVAVLIVIGYTYFDIRSKVAEVNARMAAAQAELKKTKEQIGEVSKVKEVKKVLEDKLGVIESLKNAKLGPVKMLDELSRVTPDKLWITSFKQKEAEVSIDGVSINNEIIAQFMTELDRSPQFKDVELIVTEQIDQKGVKLKKFSITSRLEGVGPKPAAEDKAKGKKKKG